MDIIEYLESKGIEYRAEGKNISSGWIGVNCPFCPDGDPSFHLGIHLDKGTINCWRCKAKGYMTKLVMYLEDIKYEQARLISDRFSISYQDDRRTLIDDEGRHGALQTTLPAEAQTELLELHENWLKRRNFKVDIFYKYKLQCTSMIGDWKFRFIIPIYMNNQLISWTSRDITEKADEIYKNAPIERCIMPVKQCLYNIDTVKDTAIIVEGATDVWRIGDGTVGTLGVQFTSNQIRLLNRVSRAFVLYDADALDEAERLAYDLTTNVPEVHILELKEGDPANLTQSEVDDLRKDIFGKFS